ncbi:hypothetical protein JA1_002219 [Spathaspora sp. JA1]|nr:hypothetical protein JA1_002219 [Spathaspora sp. JA1]
MSKWLSYLSSLIARSPPTRFQRRRVKKNSKAKSSKGFKKVSTKYRNVGQLIAASKSHVTKM